MSNIHLATICFEDHLSLFGSAIIISGGDENGSHEKSTSFAAQMMQLDAGYEISIPASSVLDDVDDSPSSFVPLAVRGWVLLITGDNPALATMIGYLKKASSAWAPCRNCCAQAHFL